MNSFAALAVLLAGTPGIFAQTSALTGRVVDESGAYRTRRKGGAQ